MILTSCAGTFDGDALVMGKFSSVQFRAYIAWTLNWTIGSVQPNPLNHELNHGSGSKGSSSGSNQIEPKPVCLIANHKIWAWLEAKYHNNDLGVTGADP